MGKKYLLQIAREAMEKEQGIYLSPLPDSPITQKEQLEEEDAKLSNITQGMKKKKRKSCNT